MKSEQSSRGTSRRTGPAGGTAWNVCAETGALLPLSGARPRKFPRSRDGTALELRGPLGSGRERPPRRRDLRRPCGGRMSRLAGAGGGTTLPGKLLWKLDPGAIDALAARLPEGAAVVSATNGKTTTTAMAAEILEPRAQARLEPLGRNLVSGVASTLLAQRDAELGLLEVDEGALPEIVRRVRPRAVLLGNLFRDQLDRYGELEHIAERWRAATAALPADTVLVVNGDDPQVGDLARDRAGAIAFGIDDPRHARPGAAACGRLALLRALRAALRVRGGVRRPPRRLPLPSCGHARPALQVRATEIELDGLEAASFTLETPDGKHPCPASASRPLQRLQRARRGRAGAGARGAAGGDPSRARAVRRRVRALRADRGRRQAAPDPPDQEPGRRERGRAHAARRRCARRSCSSR